MSVPVERCALLAFLNNKEPSLVAKLLELRTCVEDWLTYIPATFPHYTRHTVKHSDAIVAQMSKLMFYENDAARPVLSLSPMEAYIAAVSAYLHDAGMVTSDKEKTEILLSEDWKKWIAQGSGEERWIQIWAFRNGTEPGDVSLRHFIADRQVRFLIAEFIRRTHHFRAKEIMSLHQDRLGLFAFSDPILLRTIGDVCVAHGLDQKDLEDRDRYPHRRDVRDEQVNVQFLALLLRLGDLLDMHHDRACPLLLNAACPIPAESLAHWTQYQRMSHFLVTPDVIEIKAECESQEEHRYLADWCQWLIKEVQNASVLMSHSGRHNSWHPPEASMDGPTPTIRIVPSPTAVYIPCKWKFEIDAEAVTARLIEDVYESPHAFIRELIQNAVDATRCQMQLDMQAEGLPIPEFPTQVDPDRRSRYPVRIALTLRQIPNHLSGQPELRQVLTIEDVGIGMDSEVIQRYFLQIGRSYYTTADFQRKFRFVPISRFGLGFLSVFSVSDNVTVETYKPTSSAREGALRLVLSGPRSYLLIEKCRRRKPGTLIEVVLRTSLKPGEVTEATAGWCRRVEFPIEVNDLGSQSLITAESPEQFLTEVPDVTESGSVFLVRQFNVDRHGIEGELYVFARRDARGESWASWSWANYGYPSTHPQASPPPFPDTLLCINGLRMTSYGRPGPMAERLDYRDGSMTTVIARNARRRSLQSQQRDSRILSRWEEILSEHLSNTGSALGPEKWKYIQSLVGDFPIGSFWDSVPDAIPLTVSNTQRTSSLREVLVLPAVATSIAPPRDRLEIFLETGKFSLSAEEPKSELHWESEVPLLTSDDIEGLSAGHRRAIFKGRTIESVKWDQSGVLIITWVSGADQWEPDSKTVIWAGFCDSSTIAVKLFKTVDSIYQAVLFNTNNAVVQWLLHVKKNCTGRNYGLKLSQYERLREMFYTAGAYRGHKLPELLAYIRGWREIPELPPDLYPPSEEPNVSQFVLKAPSVSK